MFDHAFNHLIAPVNALKPDVFRARRDDHGSNSVRAVTPLIEKIRDCFITNKC